MPPQQTNTTTPKPPPVDYLIKLQALLNNNCHEVVNNLIKQWNLKIEIHNGKLIDTSDSTEAWLRRFITINPQMLIMQDKVRKLAKVDDEVLITGQSGTGKEIIAHALHGDRNGRFIGVNCAGIPDNLVESLLFGHVKGSFTGATETKQGYMSMAKDGTLFLDEIGELPLSVQAKFLRAIQERKIMKVGGDKEEDITCRIVCATHRDIDAMIYAEHFRLDLYARISTFVIAILPLSERMEDIEPILMSIEGGEEFIKVVKAKGLKAPPRYLFNVRSLQQMVKRYKVLGEMP